MRGPPVSCDRQDWDQDGVLLGRTAPLPARWLIFLTIACCLLHRMQTQKQQGLQEEDKTLFPRAAKLGVTREGKSSTCLPADGFKAFVG